MLMFVISGFKWLIIIAVVGMVNSDVGKVFISQQDPAAGGPIKNEYNFSSSNLIGHSLTVYALVFDSNNPSVLVPKTENITISCDVSSAGFGLSGVRLSGVPQVLLAEHNSTQISLVLTTPGRPVVVNCSAQSQNASCPAAAGTVQFCPATSKSNSVSITIRPYGSVSICQRRVRIPNNGIGSDCSFSVRLSEVPTNPVTVNCTTSAGSSGLQLNISSLEIAAGSVDGRMTCRAIQNVQAGSAATVTCFALGDPAFVSGTQVETSTALFTMGPNTVNFQPVWSQTYNTTYTSFFYLGELVGSGTVEVSCQASVVSSMDDAARPPDCSFTQAVPTTTALTTTPTTTTTTSTPTTVVTTVNGTDVNMTDVTTATPPSPPPPTTPPDPTSDWRVVNPVFDLSSSSTMFEPVTTERVRQVISVRTEIVVTTCCVMASSSLRNYHNLSAVSVTVAHLAPYVCASCRNATLTDPGAERSLQNPGFVEVAPCACDLTQNGCDVNCCCDTECSRTERARFSTCIPSLAGGQEAEPADFKCSSQVFNQPDWQALTCVFWENNWFLGLFYKNANKLQTVDDMNAQLTRTARGKFSFSETERRFTDKDSTQPSYTYGTVVRTIREDVVANLPIHSGTLSLPQPGPGASCNPLTPVRYLVDQTSSCPMTVTQELCSDLSTLSAHVYLASSAISGCSQSYKVASTVTGNQVAATDVLYYCARGMELCPYLNSDPNCEEYNRNQGTVADPALLAPCSWDNSFTAPPTPVFTGGSCTNFVMDVRYSFEWKGSEITKLSAVVILANVSTSVNISGLELVQQFSVSWLNKPNTSAPLSDNYAGTSDVYTRSGSAGYIMGKPLQSGQHLNKSTGQFEVVDVSLDKQMAIWRPGLSGLCQDTSRQPVTFGDDVLSGCMLNVTFSGLNNTCDDMRQQIINDLKALMAADVIGRYGYNDINNENMWIPVLRQALNLSGSEENSTSVTNMTSPSELQSLASSISGVCLLPSAVSLHILYTQTGAANGFPRHEVLGAYIQYAFTNFTWNCMGANSGRCDSASNSIQQMMLFSSVTFTLVPPRLRDSHRRFDTRCNPDSFLTDACYRYFTDFHTEECYYDTCWQQLAYPLLFAYQGDPQEYTLAFFLVLVLGVTGYVSVARPGWS